MTASNVHSMNFGDLFVMAISFYLLFKLIEVALGKIFSFIISPFSLLWSRKKEDVPAASESSVNHADELLKKQLISGIEPETDYIVSRYSHLSGKLTISILGGQEIINLITDHNFRCPRDIRIICKQLEVLDLMTEMQKQIKI